MKKGLVGLFLVLLLISAVFGGCTPYDTAPVKEAPDTVAPTGADSTEIVRPEDSGSETPAEKGIAEDGSYSTPEDVAEYIHKYNKLPGNYITKKEAAEMGWKSEKGNLWEVTDKMSIGGDIFGNREGRLPKAKGRKWSECDVNYNGGYRGSERILYSNDGLIYYTKDHYETFTQLY